MAEVQSRGRVPRNQEVRERRRKRDGLNYLAGQKLAVNEDFLDRNNFEYRWINDDGIRVHNLTVDDDWDLVSDPSKEGKEDVDGLGSVITKTVGKNADGTPLKAYLARKRKDWFEADRAKKASVLDEVDEALKRGEGSKTAPEAAAMRGNDYVPEGGISIQDGRKA